MRVLLALLPLAAAVTPLSKVLELLTGLKEEVTRDRLEHRKQNAAYGEWCAKAEEVKNTEMRETQQRIDEFNAVVEESALTAETLGKEILEHKAEAAEWETKQAEATKIREKEREDYAAAHKDYAESISALERAINTLKASADRKVRQVKEIPGLLLVAQSRLLSAPERASLQSFLQGGYTPPAGADGEAYGYETRSGGVIAMLKKLLEKFAGEQRDRELTETNAAGAFKLLSQECFEGKRIAEANVDLKSKGKAKAEKEGADAKSGATDGQLALEQAQKWLAEAKKGCEQKAKDFEAGQQVFADELEALTQAIGIIQGASVSGTAKDHLPQLLQVGKKAKLSPVVEKVLEHLQDDADRLGSKSLELLAERVEKDPFAKVRKLVQDLIFRLKEQAREETEKHGWCTAELAANEQSRTSKEATVEELTADIDKTTADINNLKVENAKLASEIQATNEAMAEATSVRTAERAANQQTIKEAKEGAAAVTKAMEVLREFYAKGTGQTALTQAGAAKGDWLDDNRPEFASSYTGSKRSGSVLDMMEVLASDFARLESETTNAENDAENTYKTLKQDSAVEVATKGADSEANEERAGRQKQDLTSLKKDLASTQEQLDAANKYHEQLKPECTVNVSYEQRVKMREDEIQSLKEALSILEQAA
jgi:septal ring factor EnvC (AmiA/AmiB activator)